MLRRCLGRRWRREQQTGEKVHNVEIPQPVQGHGDGWKCFETYSFYEKRAMEIVSILIRSSTHVVFIRALEDLNVSIVCSPASIQAVLSFLPCQLKHFQSDFHYTQMMYFSDFLSQMRFLYKSLQEKRRVLRGFDCLGGYGLGPSLPIHRLGNLIYICIYISLPTKFITFRNQDHYFYDPVLFGRLNQSGLGIWNAWGRTQMRTGLWWEILSERENLEDVVINERIILHCITNGRAYNGFVLLKTTGRLL